MFCGLQLLEFGFRRVTVIPVFHISYLSVVLFLAIDTKIWAIRFHFFFLNRSIIIKIETSLKRKALGKWNA